MARAPKSPAPAAPAAPLAPAAPTARTGHVVRRTRETDITLTLGLDGTGRARIDTGIPFFDHMLDAFARHGLFDLEVHARGDLAVDLHHTVEDVGLCLGQALVSALGDRRGLVRFGEATLPMDEVLAQVAVDLGGRPYFVYRGELPRGFIGTFDAALAREFFLALSSAGAMNLHAVVHTGGNAHHVVEATFKALARALDKATQRDPRVVGVPSTKGSL